MSNPRLAAIKYYKKGLKAPQGSVESQYFFDLSIQTDPTLSHAYFEKSVPYNKRGDYAEGYRLLDRAVALKPKLHLGYRGWLKLVKLKDYKGCISDLKELIRIKSDRVKNAWGENIHYLLGIALSGLYHYNDAIQEFTKALEDHDGKVNVNVFLYRGMAHLELTNLERAENDFLSCLKSNEYFTEAYYYMGILNAMRHQKAKAKLCFKKAMELYSKGYKNKNPYNEVFKELYLDTIWEKLESL